MSGAQKHANCCARARTADGLVHHSHVLDAVAIEITLGDGSGHPRLGDDGRVQSAVIGAKGDRIVAVGLGDHIEVAIAVHVAKSKRML